MDHPREAFCPYFHHAVELIGRRWTGAILRGLQSGISRFSELTALIPGLSDRMLSERLKELEAEGIVERRVIPETPVRIEYGLTTKGRDLDAVMESISGWATRWHEGGREVTHECLGEAASSASQESPSGRRQPTHASSVDQ